MSSDLLYDNAISALRAGGEKGCTRPCPRAKLISFFEGGDFVEEPMQPTRKRQRKQWRNGLGADKPPTGVGGMTTKWVNIPNYCGLIVPAGGSS
jgi:hypothetical protein